MPTYKTLKTELDFQGFRKSKKTRIPGWTDRIIFKSNENQLPELENYDSLKDVFYSDHKPVIAQFTVSFKPEQFVKSKVQKTKACCLF